MKRDKNINNDTFMYHMIQKCGYLRTLEIFFLEPTNLHFIREIGKKINLAQTSVRNHVKFLYENKIILEKKSNPFNGYIANRENEDFTYYKRFYNLSNLNSLKKILFNTFYPRAIVVFGSYCLGEDVETSDIDIFILSSTKKELDLTKFEKTFGRKINLLFANDLKLLDKKIQDKIKQGVVLQGTL